MSEKNFTTLEVGGTYETRDGHRVKVVSDNPADLYRFSGERIDGPKVGNTLTFNHAGRYYRNYEDSENDLVRRVGGPAPAGGPLDFRINTAGNEDYSRAVQERLFELGYSWLAGAGPRHLKANWLFAHGYRGRPASLMFGDHPCDSDFPVVTLTDLYVNPPEPRPDPETEELWVDVGPSPVSCTVLRTRADWRVIRDRINEAIDGGA